MHKISFFRSYIHSANFTEIGEQFFVAKICDDPLKSSNPFLEQGYHSSWSCSWLQLYLGDVVGNSMKFEIPSSHLRINAGVNLSCKNEYIYSEI